MRPRWPQILYPHFNFFYFPNGDTNCLRTGLIGLRTEDWISPDGAGIIRVTALF